MRFLKVPQKFDQVIVKNSKGETDFLIARELLTWQDCVERGVPEWMQNAMEVVNIKESETYWFFGARFEA